MKPLKPDEVIVTWVLEVIQQEKGPVKPVNRRVYLVDGAAGTSTEYLSGARRYMPFEAIGAIAALRTCHPYMQTMFVQMLPFLPEREREIPRSPRATWGGPKQ